MSCQDIYFYPNKKQTPALLDDADMKKTWKKPKLTSFGTIESVTQMQLADVVKLGEFIVPGDALGLFASLNM
jgi:hypothetical protein